MELTHQEIEALAKAGGLAPSAGNGQPWQLIAHHNLLELRLNPNFININTIPYCYIATGIFSLGMFAENICVCSRSLGLNYHLELLEPSTFNEPFAIFEYTSRSQNDVSHAQLSPLLSTLENRVTNRKLHNGCEISPNEMSILSKSTAEEDDPCTLNFISDKKHKTKIVDLLATSEVVRLRNSSLFKSMLHEIRWDTNQAQKTKDGIDVDTLELSKIDLFFLKLLKKYNFLTKILPDIALKGLTKKYMLSSVYIGCVGVPTNMSYKNLFIAGKKSQRLWLSATELNIAFHPWTGLPFMELDAIHAKSLFNTKEKSRISLLYGGLCEQFSTNEKILPVFIFRLFKASPPSTKALRRDWTTYTNFN